MSAARLASVDRLLRGHVGRVAHVDERGAERGDELVQLAHRKAGFVARPSSRSRGSCFDALPKTTLTALIDSFRSEAASIAFLAPTTTSAESRRLRLRSRRPCRTCRASRPSRAQRAVQPAASPTISTSSLRATGAPHELVGAVELRRRHAAEVLWPESRSSDRGRVARGGLGGQRPGRTPTRELEASPEVSLERAALVGVPGGITSPASASSTISSPRLRSSSSPI